MLNAFLDLETFAESRRHIVVDKELGQKVSKPLGRLSAELRVITVQRHADYPYMCCNGNINNAHSTFTMRA